MNKLTEGNISKEIFKFTIPMLLGNVFEQFYNLVDTTIIGQFIGKEALAAVGASFPIIFTLVAIVSGLTIGSTIIIAQYFGAKKIDMVKRAIDTLFITLFFSSIFVSVLGIVFSDSIFRLIKLPEEIIPYASTYFIIYIAGSIFSFGLHGIGGMLRGLGDSKTPLYFLIIGSILNTILDLIFVLNFKWGIAGVAWATVIAQAITFFIALIYLNKKHPIIKITSLKLTFDKTIFKNGLMIGFPTGIQQSFVALGMLAITRIVNNFGTNVIAAFSVASRIDSFASMPAMNFASALATFVGQNIGANKYYRVSKGLFATLKMSNIVALIMSALIIIFKNELMLLFTKDPEVIAIGASYLVIVGFFYIIFSSMFVISGVMRGAGDTLIPMFITFLSLWAFRIPVAWFLSERIGYEGIWWSVPIGWFSGALLSFIYYKTGRWKKKKIIIRDQS